MKMIILNRSPNNYNQILLLFVNYAIVSKIWIIKNIREYSEIMTSHYFAYHANKNIKNLLKQ